MRMQSGKAQEQEVGALGGHAAKDQKQIKEVNKISQISLHEVLQWWLINTVYNLLVNGGEAGLKIAY